MVNFLGINAFLQLSVYEAATQAVTGAPRFEAKEILAEVAGCALQKYGVFTAELRKRSENPAAIMQPFAHTVQRYIRRIETDNWHDHVLAIWLVGNLFQEFFAELANGIRDPFIGEMKRILADASYEQHIQHLLAEEIERRELLADSLALWGRRLVGDTLLLAREVLRLSEHKQFDAESMDPVFGALTAGHMRRMGSLSLTA